MVRLFCESSYLTFFLVIFHLHPSLSSDNSLSPDSIRLYHDIVSGHGLYNGFKMVTELGGHNFKPIVFGNETEKLWLVEFYNSWCGHCHRFAPTWKAFAANIYDWRRIIKIGVVDCAKDENFNICHELNSMSHWTLKLFFPKSQENSNGIKITQTKINELIYLAVFRNLKKYHTELRDHKEFSVIEPNFFEKRTLDKSFWTGIPDYIKFIVLVFQEKSENIGLKLALDLSQMTEIIVRLVGPENLSLRKLLSFKKKQKGVVVVDKNLDVKLNIKKINLKTIFKVKTFLEDQNLKFPFRLYHPKVPKNNIQINIGDIMVIRAKDKIKNSNIILQDSYTKVFQVDLEAAVNFALRWEVSEHENLMGQYLKTLNNFTKILMEYFPFRENGKRFLENIHKKVTFYKDFLSSKTFVKFYTTLEKRFQPYLPLKGWFNCKGSEAEYRGYPCSLWTLWHTLTVHSEAVNRGKTFTEPEVLHVITQYMNTFYNGIKCAEHFVKMSKTIPSSVKSEDDSILWLWQAHNTVNHRLAHNITEDPMHVKTQFPTKSMCPTCHYNDGSWNKLEVLKLLKSMYTNIIYPTNMDFQYFKANKLPKLGSLASELPRPNNSFTCE